MQPEDDLQQRWMKLECALEKRLGIKPDLDAILLFIGTRESGLPPKVFNETEKFNLRQMAVCTILVPARFYELFWVDDFGWPYFKELQREPELSMPERATFLKPYLLMYAEKHKLI